MRILFASFSLAFLVFVDWAARAAHDPQVPSVVTTRVTGAGMFFGDTKGMALYTYARDITPGISACVEACAKLWPPLMAAADAVESGEWTIISRDEGERQWALRGKPLYTYSKDSYPGGAFGDRLGTAWNVAFNSIMLQPGVALRALYVGRTLTDLRGMTLYTRDDEAKGKSACEKVCLDTWTPLPVPQLANAIGEWSALSRPDGTLQWAYQGKRLYSNNNDIKPGDLKGSDADKVWRAAIIEPAVLLPSWVSIQNSDMGEVFADAQGSTLYTFAGVMKKTRETICNDECMTKNWRPVAADASAPAFAGDWSVMVAADGTKQWAYKGNAVYTHLRDKEPGAIGGDKWAAGVGAGGGGFIPMTRRRDFEE